MKEKTVRVENYQKSVTEMQILQFCTSPQNKYTLQGLAKSQVLVSSKA